MAICQLCNTAESRYKCPTCLIPYCSLACYKPHKAAHDDESISTAVPNTTSSIAVTATGDGGDKSDTLASTTPPSVPAAPAPVSEPSSIPITVPALSPAPTPVPPTQPLPATSTTTSISTSRYTPLLQTPHLLPLIHQTPSLHSLLYQVYLSTLEPPPPPPSSTTLPAKNPYKIRKHNQQQAWTREIGINKGVKRLGRIREKGLAKGGDGGVVEQAVGLIVGCLGEREGGVVGGEGSGGSGVIGDGA